MCKNSGVFCTKVKILGGNECVFLGKKIEPYWGTPSFFSQKRKVWDKVKIVAQPKII